MSRSRSFNRFSRLTAKRRRRVLREALPSFKDALIKSQNMHDHSRELLDKAVQEESLLELIDSD